MKCINCGTEKSIRVRYAIIYDIERPSKYLLGIYHCVFCHHEIPSSFTVQLIDSICGMIGVPKSHTSVRNRVTIN